MMMLMEKKQNSRDWQQFFGKDPLQHLSGTNSKNGDKRWQAASSTKWHTARDMLRD